jgi:hypothetical protein
MIITLTKSYKSYMGREEYCSPVMLLIQQLEYIIVCLCFYSDQPLFLHVRYIDQ